MEQRIKQILGEYVFTIAALQSKIDTLEKEIEQLKGQSGDDSPKPKRKS